MSPAPLRDLLGREMPSAPAYGTGAVADALASAAALHRPVQALPEQHRPAGIADRLGLSAALDEAGRPRGPYRNVCLVLVDGLGAEQLDRHLGYAPTLRRAARLADLDAAFPSTTAASLATLGTGESPGRTGMVGYDVVDPSRRVVVNQLSGWDPQVLPEHWQPLPTIFQRLEGLTDVVTVSQRAYAGSALTRAALRGGDFLAAGSTTARVAKAAQRLQSPEPTLMYLYWPELDQAGHRHGVDSPAWREALEELDSGLRRLRSRTGEETLILLTADHGMVDVAAHHRISYDEHPELVAGVELTAGEPRLVQLHLADPEDEIARRRLIEAWGECLGDRAWILDREDLLRAGYFGALREGVRGRIGDLLIAASGELALYDLRRVSPLAKGMVGQHGSWTDAERKVPLLAL